MGAAANPPMTDSPRYLFVYGTLLSEAQHPMGDLLQAHATEHADGVIQARLYLITEEDSLGTNTYPGAVPSPHSEDKVHGKVFAVYDPEAIFPAFDEFEACAPGRPEPYEFLLRPIDVLLKNGGTLRAEAYLYTWDTSRAVHLPSGRYSEDATGVR